MNIIDNLLLYNKVRAVPIDAQKEITGGRLKGMTDISPMWRIKILTEQFGVCGFGWKPEIVKCWLEKGGNDELSAFVQINLFVKLDGVWSEPIPGIGGSSFVAKQDRGLYTSDECYKMAYTDAISVACKSLGVGADIYYSKDRTKYSDAPKELLKPLPENHESKNQLPDQLDSQPVISDAQAKRLYAIAKADVSKITAVLKTFGYSHSKYVLVSDYNKICKELEKPLSNNISDASEEDLPF